MTWATPDDLLLGDLTYAHLDPERYLSIAEDEMSASLGVMYPLPIPGPSGLSDHNAVALKIIQSRLASGRLLLALAAGGEDRELHAYGQHLVEAARGDLHRVGRDFELTDNEGVSLGKVAAHGSSQAAASVRPLPNSDSPFDIYEQRTHAGSDAWWMP